MLNRFHIVFFGLFLLMGLAILAIGEVEEAPVAPRRPLQEIDSIELAEKLVEGHTSFVVADWMAGPSHVRGSVKIEEDQDAVDAIVTATGGDTELDVVLLANDPDVAASTGAELQLRGYSVIVVRGGVTAWQEQILDLSEGDPRVIALSNFLQGRTGVARAGDTARAPTTVSVRPRPRTTGGGGGC